MARSEVRNLVIATLAHDLNVSEQAVHEGAHLFEDLGADSLDVIELTTTFEELFNVGISDDDLEQTTTVGNIIDLIDKKVSKNMQEDQSVQPPEDEPKLPLENEAEDDAAESGEDGDGEGDGEDDNQED